MLLYVVNGTEWCITQSANRREAGSADCGGADCGGLLYLINTSVIIFKKYKKDGLFYTKKTSYEILKQFLASNVGPNLRPNLRPKK